MSCVKCKSSPCACNDHGLTTPCDYSDCSTGETCVEVVSEECVRNTGNQDFRIDDLPDLVSAGGELLDPGILLRVLNNEPLAMTLQKIFLYLSDPDTAKESDQNGHAAYYVYFTDITSTTITVNWTGWSALADAFIINVDAVNDGLGPYVPFGSTISATGAPATISVVVTGLTPVTDYVIKVTSRFATLVPGVGSDMDSVKVHTKTLL